MLYPTDVCKTHFWDIFISLCLLITCILTPFNLAFDDYVNQYEIYVLFNYSVDLMFAIEILINFNLAFTTNTKLEDSRWEIAKDYIKSWFLIDFLSVLPFELIMISTDDTNEDSGNANKFVRMAKISKLYKLAKITKLIKMIKIMKNKKKLMKKSLKIVKTG